MKVRHQALVLSFVMILACGERILAANTEIRLQIMQKGGEEKVITRDNLIKIKQFILQSGKRETYGNSYNNNPAWHTEGFQFYLNPDNGRENIDCDAAKSDFNTLVIRSKAGGRDQYRQVEFMARDSIHVSASMPSDDLTVAQLRKFVEEALIQILSESDP